MGNFESQKGYAMQFGLIPSATPNRSFAYLGGYTAKNRAFLGTFPGNDTVSGKTHYQYENAGA